MTNDLTWDAQNAPHSLRFEDRYFCALEGREETRAVFLRGNQLPERWRQQEHFSIAELGFGTGLNFFETVDQWRKTAPPDARLTYTSFERYPLSAGVMKKALQAWPELADRAQFWLQQWPPAPKLQWDNVTLNLIIGDARTTLPLWHEMADAFYLDGFSPAKNPQLWEAKLMQAVYDHTRDGGTFSTYTAAGFVRRHLQQAGFEVERVQGFGGKRERLQGLKPGEILIRSARLNELNEIKSVLRETWHHTYDKVFGPAKVDKYCEHWHSLDQLQKRLLDKNSLVLVAHDSTKILATACATCFDDGKMVLKQIYVKPAHQRKGIGGKLYDRLLHDMPEFHSIELEVQPDNQGAIDFYQKRGFVIASTLEDCGGTGDLIKAHLMMLRPADTA